ncbi:hypothetical protein QFZ75_001369 [Streptomyces sp. V3I8]|nr:hypothetical protein [Streptomyces sp. V3I8]
MGRKWCDESRVGRTGRVPAGPGRCAPHAAGGSLVTEPVLVVNQKAKLIESTNEYKVMDQQGNRLGPAVQVGRSALRKVLRFVASIDQFMTHRFGIRDAHGQPQLLLTRPRKFLKSRVLVARPDGSPAGEIARQNMFGKIDFAVVDHADTAQAGLARPGLTAAPAPCSGAGWDGRGRGATAR